MPFSTQIALVVEPSPSASPLPAEWLFAASREPVIIVHAVSGLIIHANPAVALLLRISIRDMLGMKFVSLFESRSAPTVLRGLAKAQTRGHSKGLSVRTLCGRDLVAGLSLIRVPPAAFVLVRLSEIAPPQPPAAGISPTSAVLETIDAAPIAFLICAAGLKIDYANRAFVNMVGAESQEQVVGNSLLRWLLMTSCDIGRLTERLSQRRAADLITTAIRPKHGSSCPVEVCAIPVPDGIDTHWGFTVRLLPRVH